MNHGVRKFWILLLLTFVVLLEFTWIALGIAYWTFPVFSNATTGFSTFSMVWTYFFHQGRKLVDICGFLWNIPDILPKPSHEANSETKDELFNPS